MSSSLILGVLGGMAIFLAVFLVLQCCFVKDRDSKSGVLCFRWKGSLFKKKSDSETSQFVRWKSGTERLPDPKSSGTVEINERPPDPCVSYRRSYLPNNEVAAAAFYGSFHNDCLTSRSAPPPPPSPPPATLLLVEKGFKEDNIYVTPQNSPPINSPFTTPPESVADEKEQEEKDPIRFT
ncbi:uncharacterized protein LOC112572582 isoform X2 [Pomacea canaliculata]|uniref:uncharacterized protein LOC112572582 isoform X2 n=1 Tax=Pomacea canaliculata TaxID=400727 RepID=UPI000D73C84D|nr:uncharacterized protein LOC112572582 isoform X2 [Pomacea canaliculata]